jgi:hypothetical protein
MHDHDSDPADARRLARLLSLDPAHPERAAFERDPRQRALLRAFEEFQEAEESIAGVGEMDDAERILGSTLERALREGESPSRSRGVQAGMRPWRHLALAASVLLAIGAVWTMRPQSLVTERPTGVLRGDEVGRAELHARWDPDGALRLQWPSAPGADAYLVRIQGPALEEIATLRAETSELIIDAAEARMLSGRGATTWSVDAIVEGDERALHRTAVLPPSR